MSEAAHNEVFEIEPTRNGSRFHVPWWLLAAIAFAVAEWTAHPVLGVIIFCLKFGFNDWRTAVWLCRRDNDTDRSRTIWWFLIGSGFLKIFLVSAIAYPFLLIFLRLAFRRPVDGLELGVSVAVGVCGIGFSLIVTHIGALLAARRGVKVWLNRQIHEARDRNEWPPQFTPPNQLKTIIDASSIPAIVGLLLGTAAALVGAIQQMLPAMGLGVLMLGGSAAILISHAILLKRIIAVMPGQCWSEHRQCLQITMAPRLPRKNRPEEDPLHD